MATRKFVPRGSGEGGIGTNVKKWGPSHFTEVNSDDYVGLPAAAEATAGIVQLASAAEVLAGTVADKAVVPSTLDARTATEIQTGLVELATEAEVLTGTDADRAVTPATLQTKIDAIPSPDILYTGLALDVGVAGDFATITEALAEISLYIQAHQSPAVVNTITLLSGFVMNEQVLVNGLDFGNTIISGEDATTIINSAALTTNFANTEYGITGYPAFGVKNGGKLPALNQSFDMQLQGTNISKHGVMVVGAGSSALIMPGAGVVKSGGSGLYVSHGAVATASSAVISSSAFANVYSDYAGTVNVENADLRTGGTYGIFAAKLSRVSAIGADARVIPASTAADYTVSSGSSIYKNTTRGAVDCSLAALNTNYANGIVYGT